MDARGKFGEHEKFLKRTKKSKQTSLLAGQKHATFYTLVCAGTFDPVNR